MTRIALLIAGLAIVGMVTEASAQRRTCNTSCYGGTCTTVCR